MDFGWKVLLPISVLNLVVTVIFVVLNAEGVFTPMLDFIRTTILGM